MLFFTVYSATHSFPNRTSNHLTTYRNISSIPFTSAGATNKNYKKTFSSFTYECSTPIQNPHINLHGIPQTTHRGVTSLRHKTTTYGTVGSGLPYHNTKLDGTKDLSWQPSSYQQLNPADVYRRMGKAEDVSCLRQI